MYQRRPRRVENKCQYHRNALSDNTTKIKNRQYVYEVGESVVQTKIFLRSLCLYPYAIKTAFGALFSMDFIHFSQSPLTRGFRKIPYITI